MVTDELEHTVLWTLCELYTEQKHVCLPRHDQKRKEKKIVLTVSGNGCPRVSDTFHMVQVERSQSYDGH